MSEHTELHHIPYDRLIVLLEMGTRDVYKLQKEITVAQSTLEFTQKWLDALVDEMQQRQREIDSMVRSNHDLQNSAGAH